MVSERLSVEIAILKYFMLRELFAVLFDSSSCACLPAACGRELWTSKRQRATVASNKMSDKPLIAGVSLCLFVCLYVCMFSLVHACWCEYKQFSIHYLVCAYRVMIYSDFHQLQ